jgi:serine/threonine protein kinase
MPLHKLPAIGSVLCRKYRLTDDLGTGAFGKVYKSIDQTLDRTVAIKFLSAGLDYPVPVLEAAINEARTLAKLDHPNIVRIYEVSRVREGQWMIVNNYLQGEDLQEIHWRLTPKNQRLPMIQALSVINQLFCALQHAHERTVIHRDIKPANLIWDGCNLTLIDFGIAIREGQQYTFGGLGAGTEGYQHPKARAGDPDEQTDLFAAGIVAYQLLTGMHPFLEPMVVFEDRFELLLHPAYRPISCCQRNPGVPAGIGKVIDRLLVRGSLKAYWTSCKLKYGSMKQADAGLKRYSSAKQVLDAIRRNVDDI